MSKPFSSLYLVTFIFFKLLTSFWRTLRIYPKRLPPFHPGKLTRLYLYTVSFSPSSDLFSLSFFGTTARVVVRPPSELWFTRTRYATFLRRRRLMTAVGVAVCKTRWYSRLQCWFGSAAFATLPAGGCLAKRIYVKFIARASINKRARRRIHPYAFHSRIKKKWRGDMRRIREINGIIYSICSSINHLKFLSL